MAMEAIMPKALARNEMMTRGNIETVVDNVSVVSSKASSMACKPMAPHCTPL